MALGKNWDLKSPQAPLPYEEGKLLKLAFSLYVIILTRLDFHFRFQSCSLAQPVSSMQVAAGLFVLLDESSLSLHIVKAPLFTAGDVLRWLSKPGRKNKTFSQIWCSSIANKNRQLVGFSRWKTCFGRSSLIHLAKPWSQTAWRSLVCELAEPSGTDRRLQNSGLGTAYPPLQEAVQDTTVRTQSVCNCHPENW